MRSNCRGREANEATSKTTKNNKANPYSGRAAAASNKQLTPAMAMEIRFSSFSA